MNSKLILAFNFFRPTINYVLRCAETSYFLTPWCRVLLEELTGLQLVKKFPAFHQTRRFITALTSVRQLSLSWTSPIQSTYHLLEIHPNIIHPSTPRSPQWFLPSDFPTKTLYTPLSSPIRSTCPTHLILLNFITRTILGEETSNKLKQNISKLAEYFFSETQ